MNELIKIIDIKNTIYDIVVKKQGRIAHRLFLSKIFLPLNAYLCGQVTVFLKTDPGYGSFLNISRFIYRIEFPLIMIADIKIFGVIFELFIKLRKFQTVIISAFSRTAELIAAAVTASVSPLETPIAR